MPQAHQIPMHLILMTYKFFFEGEPDGKDLEDVEEDKILEIHRAFQQKLKERERCRKREKYNKKDTRI